MRDELPHGTVTFLFTDVEGSTELLHDLGAEAYAAALAEHRRLIREACANEDGVEVDTQGDAFFFAFPTASGALAAASELTDRLASGRIQVRVGVHTGTPLLTDEGYVGHDVHRAARIAAAGYGEQVLVSSSTAQLVGRELTDLGEHRFKDLAAPERVFQLGSRTFPPLRSLYRTNLPVPATPFLGRERELAEAGELLARDDVRLLTLVGPGGTGKTRLAMQAAAEAADDYPDGVFWVALAPVRDPELVLVAAAQALGADDGLAEHVGDKKLLLLLDNFEHVLAAATSVADLLSSCRNASVVVTSRELLQLQAEHTYPVPTFAGADGLRFFEARARAVDPSFRADNHAEELCERLDNLPLALELAASRTRHLTPAQLLARLGDRLDLLKGGRDADPRQQTLRATIAWSHDLLDDREQNVFARLSVFAGGSTLESAAEVADADLDALASLVDKSLLRRTGERFWMLETIREFAAERLEDSGSAEKVRGRHAAFFVALAPTLGFTIESIEKGALQRHDIAIAEQSNVRAAIGWGLEADPVLALRLAASLENFWISHNPYEGRRLFDELVAAAADAPAELRALATRCRGNFAIFTEETECGIELYEESLALYCELGDEQGAALVEHRLGINLYAAGERERGREILAQSLAHSRAAGFRVNEMMARGSLGSIEFRDGNVEHGLELMKETIPLARKVGFTWWETNMQNTLASYHFELDRYVEAESHALSALELAGVMEDRRHAVQALGLLAQLATLNGDRERAGRLWGALEAEEGRGPVGMRPRLAAWGPVRERFAEVVLAVRDAELERAIETGRRLSLAEAIEYATATRSSDRNS